MTAVSLLLWVALPYAVAAVFVLGHVWRYRHDRFGWTTRSSQLHESRLLRIGSPLFHFGILLVIGGHVVGLLVPAEWLAAIGADEHVYHLGATWLGSLAAAMTIAGLGILIVRRVRNRGVRRATTAMDKVMYGFVAATILAGTAATLTHQVFGGGYDYRSSISPWFRSLLLFQPQPELMAGAPLLFQLHILLALALFALWPFTRLVHVLSAPVGYLVRPYVVYRSRDAQRGSRPARRGWAPVDHGAGGR